MPGFQELFLILLILAGLFVIPRMIQRPPLPPQPHVRPKLPNIPAKWRLAIVATALWLGLAAAYFEPWRSGWERFAFFGGGIVAAVWGAVWVVRGFQQRPR